MDVINKGGEVGMTEYIIKVDEDKKDIMGNYPLVEKPQELVRCKDCKHWSAERINDFNKCRRWINVGVKNFATIGEWFCADGERRDS